MYIVESVSTFSIDRIILFSHPVFVNRNVVAIILSFTKFFVPLEIFFHTFNFVCSFFLHLLFVLFDTLTPDF